MDTRSGYNLHFVAVVLASMLHPVLALASDEVSDEGMSTILRIV